MSEKGLGGCFVSALLAAMERKRAYLLRETVHRRIVQLSRFITTRPEIAIMLVFICYREMFCVAFRFAFLFTERA